MRGGLDPFEGLAKLADVFFNGRPATPEPEKPKVTVEELVKRGTSVVRVGGKLYRFRVKEVELT